MFAPLTISKAELDAPVTEGKLQSILILYPVPEAVPAGIVTLIFPDGLVPSAVAVPILTGEAKLPLASESLAVKVADMYAPVDV